MFILFNIAGGIGKNIMATSVVRSIKKAEPDSEIVITTAWPDVWTNNPNVYRVYLANHAPYYYENYVKDDTKVFFYEPYYSENYIHKKHLIDSWCEMCGVPFDRLPPELFFTPREKEVVKRKLPEGKLFFLQSHGGQPHGQALPISWARDIPIKLAQEVINKFKETHTVIHLKYKEQIGFANTVVPEFSLREAMCSIQFSDKRLLIDSFAQHVASAMDLPSTVLWIGTNPKQLGYTIHTNIQPTAPMNPTKSSQLLYQFNMTGVPEEYPFDTLDIFETETVINTL